MASSDSASVLLERAPMSLVAGVNVALIPKGLEIGAEYTTVIGAQRDFDAIRASRQSGLRF
jgi:hypothetical protein